MSGIDQKETVISGEINFEQHDPLARVSEPLPLDALDNEVGCGETNVPVGASVDMSINPVIDASAMLGTICDCSGSVTV